LPQQQCAFELTQDVGCQSFSIGGLDAEMLESAVGTPIFTVPPEIPPV
jgi:hypothetical protein